MEETRGKLSWSLCLKEEEEVFREQSFQEVPRCSFYIPRASHIGLDKEEIKRGRERRKQICLCMHVCAGERSVKNGIVLLGGMHACVLHHIFLDLLWVHNGEDPCSNITDSSPRAHCQHRA